MRRATKLLAFALTALASSCAAEHASDDAELDGSVSADDAWMAPDEGVADLYALCVAQCGRGETLVCPGRTPLTVDCETTCADEVAIICCRPTLAALLACDARTPDADYCSIGEGGLCAAELAAAFGCSPAPDAGC